MGLNLFTPKRRPVRLRSALLTAGAFLVTGCGSHDAASELSTSGAPVQTSDGGVLVSATPSIVVAGEDQVWSLTEDHEGFSISRFDSDGDETEVLKRTGRAEQMIPYSDGAAVASVRCAAQPCDETTIEVTVIDGDGSVAIEGELWRQEGAPERSDSVSLLGAQGDLIWAYSAGELVAYAPGAGQVETRVNAYQSVPCLLEDGMYALAPLGEAPEHGVEHGPSDAVYEVGINHLVDDEWRLVPGSERTLDATELAVAECVAGVISTGMADTPSAAWSPSTGWMDRDPFATRSGPTTDSQAGQRFYLESDTRVRRVFSTPEDPLRVETIELPSETFTQTMEGPPARVIFDQSPTVFVACIHETSDQARTGTCYIRPV